MGKKDLKKVSHNSSIFYKKKKKNNQNAADEKTSGYEISNFQN